MTQAAARSSQPTAARAATIPQASRVYDRFKLGIYNSPCSNKCPYEGTFNSPCSRRGRAPVANEPPCIGFQAGPQTWAVWELQKADSRAEYTTQRAVLATLNPKAVDYLDSVGPETWCMFAIDTAGFKMHGMRTSNIVEAENARLLGARSMAPNAFLDETVRLKMAALSTARIAKEASCQQSMCTTGNC